MLSHSVVPNSLWSHGQGKNTEWVAISFSGGSSRPRDRTHIIGEQQEGTGNHEPGALWSQGNEGVYKEQPQASNTLVRSSTTRDEVSLIFMNKEVMEFKMLEAESKFLPGAGEAFHS